MVFFLTSKMPGEHCPELDHTLFDTAADLREMAMAGLSPQAFADAQSAWHTKSKAANAGHLVSSDADALPAGSARNG